MAKAVVSFRTKSDDIYLRFPAKGRYLGIRTGAGGEKDYWEFEDDGDAAAFIEYAAKRGVAAQRSL